MQNTQSKLDLSSFTKEERDYLERCIQDSECLRANLDNESVPHWKLFYQLNLAFTTYMNSDWYIQSCSQPDDGQDFQLILRHLGALVEHVVATQEV